VAYGPGVVDMKGSDVIIVYALKALHETGQLDGTTISVVFTGDEEKVGSPLSVSRRDLIKIAQHSDVALGFEQWANDGKSATVARRGTSQWSLQVSGIRAHSSDIFSEEAGSGAVFEAARILNAFHEELRGEKYLTFNPGVILGGTEVDYDFANSRGTAFGKTNVIAQTAIVDGGLRFISEKQKESAQERMRQIISRNLPGTSAKITFEDGYPAMPPTEGNLKLLEVLNKISIDLGNGTIDAFDPGKRGAADISFVAPYVDALAGLGTVGRGSHTEKESIDLRFFSKITQRAALLIYRLAR
jgi:glutamate carboxypeptidase